MANYFDTSNAKPLNNVYDVPRSQYKNLYGIPSESPVVEQGDEMPDLSQYSLANWLKNNHFDAVDQGRKANLVKRYRNEIVPMIAHYVGEDAEAAKVNFDNQLPEEIKQATRPINRNAWGWINDNVNTAGNAIFGLGKSVSDLINPDSSVSQWLDDRIQDGLGMSSDYMKDQRLKTELDVSEAKKNGDWGVGASLGFYWRNPAQLVAEVAGNLGPFGVVGKGAKTIGLGTKTTQGTMAGLGAAMGAGEVRGNIYEHMMKMPEDRLLTDSPQYKALLTYGVSPEEARKEVATAVSKHLGEIGVGGAVGLASGLVGVEKILSGAVSQKGIGTVAKTALGEGVSEAIEEGTIATASNYAIRKNDTQQNLFDNVAINAAKGAVLGAFSGGGVAAINSFTGDDSASEIVENMSSQTVGDNALKVNAPTLPNQLNTSNGETNPNSPVIPDTITDANVDSVLKGLAQKYGQGDEGRTTAIYNELIRSHQAGLLPKLAESGSVANNAAAEFLEIVSGERSLTHGQSPDQVVEETTPIPTVAEQNAMANNPVPEQMANLVPEQSVGGTQAIPPIIPAQDNPISPTVENTPPIPDSTKAEENTEPSSDDEGFALEQKNSRSAIKSVQANIKRGRDAMNTAIAERRTVHRAMFNHELNGWVDFEWGDTGRMLPNGKTKGAMGISHIIDKRMRVDGMSEQEVSRFLVEDVIETIAKGKISREKVLDKTRAVEIVYSGNEVRVTKKEGNNAWIVTGFKQFQPVNQSRGATTSDLRINSPIRSRTEMGAVGKVKTDTHSAGSVDTEKVTHSKPTLMRQGMGASDANNVLQSKPEVKQTPMSEAMAQHVQAIEKAVLKAIGRGNKRHVRIDTRANLERPDDLQSLNLDGVEGWFDPRTGQIMLVADNLTPETAAFVAWHELGHRGIASRAFREFKGLLNSIRNPYINQLADLIMGERQKANENGANDRAGTNRLVAIEEAVVELLAAKNTGNWQHLENKYGLQVPTTFKQNTPSALTLIMRRMKEIIASIFGRQSQDMGDKEVIRLLQLVNQAIELDAQVGGEGDIRYSLNESSDSAFAKAVDAVANGEVVEKQIIDVGTTPDVLKMLGLPDTNVTISSAVLKKVMFGKHNVTANSLKKLPSQINSPVAVMQSSTQENGYVVLTELTEYVDGINKPVIAALHLKESRDGLALINIASVYGRNISQIQRGLENDLLYWNKEKGAKFLDNLTLQLRSPLSENSSEKGSQFLTAFGLQLPSHMQSNTNLSDNNIKTEKDLLQYQEGKTAEKVAYEQDKANGLTNLSYEEYLQTRSDAFKAFFGDWENNVRNVSKVVDENTNEPLVLYHGSGSIFNVYDPNKMATNGLQYGAGFYFTDSENLATAYSKEGGEVQKVYLNIRKWLSTKKISITDKQIREILSEIDNINEDITEDGVLSNFTDVRQDGISQATSIALKTLRENKNDIDLIDELTSLGGKEAATKAVYNVLGAVGNKVMLPGGDMVYIVLASNQIKSATRNNGEFDAKNEDIRFSRVVNRSKKESLEKLRQSESINISGKEIEASEDLRQYKRNALEYGKSLRGTYVNKDSGRRIELGASGVKEVLQHDYKNPEHLQSVAAIPQIIENAIYIDTLQNEDLEKNPSIQEYEYYVAGLNIGGRDYTVKAVVAISENGERYYDHKLSEINKDELLSYSHRITNPGTGKTNSSLKESDLLEARHADNKSGVPQHQSTLEKDDLLSRSRRITNPADKSNSSFNSFDDKRLLQILQDNSASDGNIRFSRQKMTASNAEVSPLEDITDKFNQELAEFVNGQLTGSHIFNLGKPSELLKSVGFPDLPIELKASKLSEKANTDWHKFDIADVKGLPNALQNPLAVFSYGDKTKSHNVITQLEIGGKQLLVGVHFNQNRNGLSVNSIRGLFPKDNAEWLNWIGQKDKNGDDKHLYLDKQKIQTLINQQRTNLADVGYLDLDLIESLIQKLDGVNDDENQQKTTAKFSRKREIEEDAKVKIQDLVSRARQDKTLKRMDEFARKAEVLQGEPVYTITERKAPKENSALRQWAIDLFNRAGGKAVNPEIGEVTLNERSVKNSMAHGMNPLKASAFESISKVIEQGVVIAQAEHGETTSYFISAPVRIENVDTLVNVLVHKDVNKQSMYLHSVQTKENLLDLTKNESVADIEISKPHGKLSPRDIASILQKHLVFNLDENSGKKFSRKREIEEDAKVKIQDLVSRVRQDKTLKRTDEFARKAEVLQGEPVYTITERKAPKENSALRQWAIDLFNRAGGKAVNPEIGEVILNARSVKDDLAHGISPDKATAFEAVVDVIEKGVVVATANHERLTSSFISAPVEIEGKVNIVTALVRKDANSQRFYLHSVIPKEKLLKEALTGLYGDSVADVKTSEPHGKLRSGDIASILQKHLVFNLDENSGKKFSRKREIEEDAKVKIQDLVSRVRQDKTLNEQVDLMPVPEVAVKEAEKYGLSIKGFTRLIDSSAINHILNKHGNEKKEVARGQLPIRDKDFVDIIEVYNNPDKVVYGGKTRIGRDAIFYLKKNNDDSIVVVEESITKRRKLALTSMRKYPSTVRATSILKSLNLNAQSDFDGNGIIVEDNPAPRNSSEPKFSRKPTQANVSPVRQASTFEEARKEAKDFQGKVLTNNDSNIAAVVSRNSLDKMLSGKAVNKSVSPKIHALAVANIDKLYENAIYGWSKEDRNKDTNINAIHRFFAVLNTDEGQRLVKLTVKETAQTDRNNRLYTLEAVSLNEETPAAQWVGEMLQQDNVEPRTIRSARDIDNLAQSVEKNNSNLKFSRKPTSILPEVKEPKSIKSIASSFSVKDATKVVKSFVTGGGQGVQPKWLEDLTTLVFDGKNPLSNVIRRFGTPEARDLELTMRTYQAMTAKVTQDFEEGMYAPMIETLSQAWNKTFKKHYKEMGAAGWKQFLEDIGTTQNLVLHGRERNAEIRRKTQGKDEAGSGRTDAEIEEIEKVLNQQVPGLIDFTKQVYKNHLKPMLDYRDKLLRESGLLTQEMEDARPQYEWYVPLFGDPNEDGAMDNGFVHQAVGELRDIKDKQAKGRAGTLADNPLENVLTATQTAIYRAGQQVFLEKLFDFLEKNPSARRVMGAKINTSQTKEIFTKYVDKDGFVKERLKPNASMDKDAIVFRNGDKVSVVKIGNRNILNALKGLNKAHIEGVLRLISRPTRFLSKVYTRYNPMFPLMNKLRDSQAQMVFVLSDAPVKHKARAAFKATRYNAAFTLQWRQNPNSDYHQWREEYEHLGGTSPYIDLFRDDVMANLSEDFAQAVGVDTKAKIKKMGNAVAKVIDGINEHFEMTSRIATYKALVEEGMSKKEAVLYVKNLMNFETKGKYGQELGAFYAFANAALFDARRTMQALRTPRGAAVFAVSFAIQYAIYGALKALGGDDEDGIARLNKVPLSSAGRWWLLIDSNDPEGKGLKFPVGFGMGGRIPLTIAAALHRWHDGVDDLGTFTSNVMKEGLAANFSPLEPIDIDPTKDLFGYLMQQFSPTSVRPIVQLASNKTGQGAPIHKLDTWVGQGLKFDNALPATNRLFSNIAKWVYDETGVDSYPETWRFLFQSYLGTGSMELLRSWMLADEKAGTQWTLSDIPLAQAFAHKGDKYDVMVYREMENEVQRLMNERDYAYEQGRGFEFDQEHPGLVQVSVYIKEASKQLKKLNRTKKAYELIEDPRERQEKVKAITQEMRHIQMFVNKEVKVMLENE